MMPYDFALEEAPAWPDSLRPVYCAYVARHGARYMTGPKKFDKLEPVLRREAEAGNLTADGRALLAMVDSVRTLSEGKWGQLSAVGIHEQELLGAGMTRLVPELGRDDTEVATLSSFVPRAMMTMYEFNHAMMLRNDRLDVTACSGHMYSPLVYFFDTDSVYRAYRKDGAWKGITDRYQAENIPVAPLRRLFVRPVNIKKHKQQELVMDIYSLLQSRRAMGLAAPSDRFMSAAEYRQCWMLSNLSHYLRNCQSPLSGNIVPRSVATLVEYIIDDADRSLGDPVMRNGFSGYFGHAEHFDAAAVGVADTGVPRHDDGRGGTGQTMEIGPGGASRREFRDIPVQDRPGCPGGGATERPQCQADSRQGLHGGLERA